MRLSEKSAGSHAAQRDFTIDGMTLVRSENLAEIQHGMLSMRL